MCGCGGCINRGLVAVLVLMVEAVLPVVVAVFVVLVEV